ncbi:MAG: outer membrane lipoprotein-sorting protein [candidate division Zixibacteria bacterium]|nr:outer membrane lipoprotein-sorting protein [candidate division Zixibacteria bacterium]
MNKYTILILSLAILLSALPSDAQENQQSAFDILDAVDRNMLAETKIVKSRMIVHGRRGDRTVSSQTWIHGENRAFTEYLSPAREKGTKMLRLDDNLWTYSPRSDRVIQISGHMLRQSVMGSDLSYEDMMEQDKLTDVYEAIIEDSELIDDRDCWRLLLTGKEEGLAYQIRKIWIDKDWYLPLKEQRFGHSGKLLKSTKLSDVIDVDGRKYPGKIIFKDELKSGSRGTEWIIDEIEFDVDIPEIKFSKASLKK